jgi:hypothetical protein
MCFLGYEQRKDTVPCAAEFQYFGKNHGAPLSFAIQGGMEIGKATFFENRLKMEPKDLSPSATYKSPNKILKATTKSVGEGASTAEKAAIIKPRGPYGKRDIGSLGENCHEARYRPETQMDPLIKLRLRFLFCSKVATP